ncbi:hypothetical protein TNCV_3543811 [Trichonephila clavipes]|nr:hypothetical protein TNCV_3543811 [Trichonephila clavipes]
MVSLLSSVVRQLVPVPCRLVGWPFPSRYRLFRGVERVKVCSVARALKRAVGVRKDRAQSVASETGIQIK